MRIANKYILYLSLILLCSGCSIRYYIDQNDLNKVKEYISEGNNINDGYLLRIAIYDGHYSIAKLLIESGALFSDSDFVKVAGTWDSAELIKYMIKKGANVNAKTPETPLMSASRMGHNDVVNTLLANGADINALTKDSLSAWMLALKSNKVKTAQLLLEKGADFPTGVATVFVPDLITIVGHHSDSPLFKVVSGPQYITIFYSMHTISYQSGEETTYGDPITISFNAENNGIYIIDYELHIGKGKWNAQIKKIWPKDGY